MAPVARKADGSPLTGPVLERLIDMPPNTTVDLRPVPYVGLTYQRPSRSTPAKPLYAAHLPGGRQALSASDWAFADCTTTPFPGTPDPAKLCVKGGFDPASEYVLIYTAKDPLVLGIGYAATRDLNSFLRYGEQDDTGTPNPLAGTNQVGHQPRRFAIRQLHPQLHPPRLQPG